MSVTLHTNLGDIKIEVHCDLVPLASENFLALCASGYYNNTKFHRNIKGFIVQGGDPTGTGKGGKSIWGKRFKDEFTPELKHNTRGVVGLANHGPDQNSSQFYITYQKHNHLDNKYTILGRVIAGMETLGAMEKLAQPANAQNNLSSQGEIILEKVTLHANPFADSSRFTSVL